MTGEVLEQGTIPDQQQPLAGNPREHIRTEQQTAGQNARDREQAAQKHHPIGICRSEAMALISAWRRNATPATIRSCCNSSRRDRTRICE